MKVEEYKLPFDYASLVLLRRQRKMSATEMLVDARVNCLWLWVVTAHFKKQQTLVDNNI